MANEPQQPEGDRSGRVWRCFRLQRLPAVLKLPPSKPSELAAKAKDLEALRDAVVDAAGVSGGLWLSYLFVLLYLAIAAGGVTHRDLFFENPVKLPFLNVDLPLLGFFVLGPLLFLMAHANVLLHFSLLSGKVTAFDTELDAPIKSEDVKARRRRQIPSIFVQFLAGPPEVRKGPMFFMLGSFHASAWLSLLSRCFFSSSCNSCPTTTRRSPGRSDWP